MQLLKWLRQEGALPRDLAYPLEDAEESLADFLGYRGFSRSTHVGRWVLEPGSSISVALLPREVDQCGPFLGASRKHSFMNPCC